MCLSLRVRCYIIERLEDAAVGVVSLATCGGVSLLGGDELTEHLERTQILESLRRQLLTLGVLGDEVDLHALDLIDTHLRRAVDTLRVDVGGERTQTVPLDGLAALQQLNHHRGELLNDTLNDVTAVNRLIEGDTLNQTTEVESLGPEGNEEPLAVSGARGTTCRKRCCRRSCSDGLQLETR